VDQLSIECIKLSDKCPTLCCNKNIFNRLTSRPSTTFGYTFYRPIVWSSITLRSHRRRSSVFIGAYREAVSSPMNTEFELIFPSRRVRLTSRQFRRISAGSKIASFKMQILIFPGSSLFISVYRGTNAGQEGNFGHR